MSEPFSVFDLSGEAFLQLEPMGSKEGKRWFALSESGDRVLFKPVTFHEAKGRRLQKGDDWAEKLAAEIALRLEIPAARVEFATYQDQIGISSYSVLEQYDQLDPGNQFLYKYDPSYVVEQRQRNDQYTVQKVFSALTDLKVGRPITDLTASAGFANYLALDALIGNTDRHHENWAVLWRADDPPRLAPTFDHASSMGFQLDDDERRERIETNDTGYTVEAYAERAKSRHFAGRPKLVDLAVEAFKALDDDDYGLSFRRRLELNFNDEAVDELVNRIPGERMSQPCRIFVARLLKANRRRLLDELDSHYRG